MDLVMHQVMTWTMLGMRTAGWQGGLPQAGVSGEPPDKCARQGHGWKLRLPERGGEDLDARQQSIRTPTAIVVLDIPDDLDNRAI